MGRAAKLRKTRAWARLYEEARKLEASASKKPCDSCAFLDPTAWITDVSMGHKLIQCLTEPGHRFFCHQGLQTQIRLDGTVGAYIPPHREDGTIDTRQLEPCGGYLRWALSRRTLAMAEQIKDVLALQLRMARRFLESDAPFAIRLKESCNGRADILQKALNARSRESTEFAVYDDELSNILIPK